MELKEAIDSIFNGNALLITGSGFSKGARNKEGFDIPSVSDLKKKIITDLTDQPEKKELLNGINDLTLSEISDYCISDLQKQVELIQLIQEQFGIKSTSTAQKFLSSLNWFGIYTTNYDNVIEEASQRFRKSVTVSTNLNSETFALAPVCHLNGDLTSLNLSSIKSDFKLTDESYSTSEVDSPLYCQLYDQVEASQAIFIIGLSLDGDVNLKQLISDAKTTRRKIFFINGKKSTDAVNNIKQGKLNHLGTFTGLTTDEFYLQVKNEEVEWRKTKLERPKKYRSFDRIQYNATKENQVQVKDADVDKLIFEGRIDETKLSSPAYCLQRIKNIDARNFKNGQIHIFKGKIGNGKTIYLRQLANMLSIVDPQKKIYWFNGNDSTLYKDLFEISHDPGTAAIFIDNFYTVLGRLKCLQYLSNSNIAFYFSGRSSIVQENLHHLTDLIQSTKGSNKSNFSISTLDIDCLELTELKAFRELIKNHNLTMNSKYWGKQSIPEFYSLISDLLESRTIAKRYEFSIQMSSLSSLEQKIIYFIVVTNAIGSLVDVPLIRSLFNIQETPYTLGNGYISEFIDFSNNKILMTSSVLSRFLLSRSTRKQKQEIVNLLTHVMKKLDIQTKKHFKSSDGKRHNLQRNLVSFSNFRLIMEKNNEGPSLSETQSLAADYFESISQLEFCKSNEYFWLQYAIERMDILHWRLAKNYLDKAIKLSNQNQYSLTQISTQEIRWYVSAPDSQVVTPLSVDERIDKVYELLPNAMKKNEDRCLDQLRGLPNFVSNALKKTTLNESKRYTLSVSLNILITKLRDLSALLEFENPKLWFQYKDMCTELTSIINRSL